MALRKSVCVIGAGVSGLVTLKELLDEGQDAHLFEACDTLGGAFAGPGRTSANRVYEHLTLTISNFYMAFSDFPPKGAWRFWSAQEYIAYLDDYARHFDLERHMTFNARVEEMVRVPEGWRVTVRDTRSAACTARVFDAVAVAIGSHQEPSQPTFPGMEVFKGVVAHSYNYRNAGSLAGKNVVVVGLGESGADIVREISDVSASCNVLVRKYPFCLPRLLPDGHPADALTARLIYPQRDDTFAKWFMLLVFFTFVWLPLSWFRWSRRHMEWGGDRGDPQNALGLDRGYSPDAQWMDEGTHRTREIVDLLSKWHVHENSSFVNKFAVKNVSWLPNVVAGKCNIHRTTVARVTPTSVIDADGNEYPCDVLFLCTGYVDVFPFFPDEALRPTDVRRLFLHAFDPRFGASVAFVGFARPTSGAVPACSELVARYFALLCSGRRTLPANMEQLIDQQFKHENRLFFNTPQVRTLVNPCEYMDDVAKLIGCYESPWRYWYQPVRYIKYLICQNVVARYRLTGPHAKAPMAREWLDRVTFPLPHAFLALPMFLKLAFTLGYNSGDFVVDIRALGLEATRVLALGAPTQADVERAQQSKR